MKQNASQTPDMAEFLNRLLEFRFAHLLRSGEAPTLDHLTREEHAKLALLCKECGVEYTDGKVLGMVFTPRDEVVKEVWLGARQLPNVCVPYQPPAETVSPLEMIAFTVVCLLVVALGIFVGIFASSITTNP